MTGIKNVQTQPKLPAIVPQFFDEDLVKRAFPVRFRNIGNPNQYLNEIGIIPILEFIYKGHLLIDVAEATNVPLTTLRLWIEHEGHFDAVSEAETQSAEGFLAEGMRRLRTAPTEFELRRANAIIKHAQYMATKKNKPMYGDSIIAPNNNTVNYQFNIGPGVNPADAADIIEGVSRRVPAPPTGNGQDSSAANPNKPVALNLEQLYGLPFGAHDAEHAMNDTPIQPQLVQPRPRKPTPRSPDIGPFFDDPLDQERTELPVQVTG